MGGNRSSVLGLLGAGFAIWAVGFVLVYAALSVGCAAGWASRDLGPVSLQRAILVGLGLATAATCALLTARLAPRRRSREDDGGPAAFVTTVAFQAALAATGATLFTFSGVATLSMCSP